MQFILQLLLQPLFELVFYVLGYATAWVAVPVFTFGHVTVEPSRNGKLFKPSRRRIQRAAPGKYIMEVGLAVLIGWLFWITVVVVACLLR